MHGEVSEGVRFELTDQFKYDYYRNEGNELQEKGGFVATFHSIELLYGAEF